MILGRRILLVEDDAVIAADLADLIAEAGGTPVGPVATLGQVEAMMPTLRADAALLDLNVADGQALPALDWLAQRGVPVVVYTGGHLPADVYERHLGLAVLQKPVQPARLLLELRRALEAAEDTEA